MVEARSYGDDCGVARGLDLVGERWALLVVRELLLGPKRFADIQDGLSGISPNVLSQRLRELEARRIVERIELGPPLRVHLYQLTPLGRGLEPVVVHLGRWGAQFPHLSSARLGVDSMMLGIKAMFVCRTRDQAATIQDGPVFTIVIADETFVITAGGDHRDVRRLGMDEQLDPSRVVATATVEAGVLRSMFAGTLPVDTAVAEGDLRLVGDPEARSALAQLLGEAAGLAA